MILINDDPIAKLEELNVELRKTGYEVSIRRIATKRVDPFDFGLIFTKDSKEVGLYVDDDLRAALDILANEHGQILVKTNWFSPDVIVVTPADDPLGYASQTSQEAPGSIET